MKTNSWKPGDTFLMTGDLSELDFRAVGQHLHIVLSHPVMVGGHMVVAAVTVSSYDGSDAVNYIDDTCILLPGEGHSFIQHRSYVVYSQAGLAKISSIEENIEKRGGKKKEPLTEELLRRVIYGAWESRKTPPRIQHVMGQQRLT
jgi:hypothetical protein